MSRVGLSATELEASPFAATDLLARENNTTEVMARPTNSTEGLVRENNATVPHGEGFLMDTFYIKRNDTAPTLEVQLEDHLGDNVDITGYNSVSFHMWNPDSGTVVVDDDTTGNVSVVDAAQGVVSYEWVSGDTDTAGTYAGEWEVTYSDGGVETFPNNGNDDIEILEDGA